MLSLLWRLISGTIEGEVESVAPAAISGMEIISYLDALHLQFAMYGRTKSKLIRQDLFILALLALNINITVA